MNDLNETIFRSYDKNLEILSELKEAVEKKFLIDKIPYNEFVDNLYRDKNEEKWFLSQCQSICNQINKLLNKNSWINKYPSAFFTDNDRVMLSQEIIFDISYLEQLTEYKYEINKKVKQLFVQITTYLV